MRFGITVYYKNAFICSQPANNITVQISFVKKKKKKSQGEELLSETRERMRKDSIPSYFTPDDYKV